jgi:aminoglycoside 2''-phosphotransferase
MDLLRRLAKALLPEAVLTVTRSIKSYRSPRSTLSPLLQTIRTAFPEVYFTKAELIDSGFSNIVVILDNKWVFRFPRGEYQRSCFTAELRLLAELRQKTLIAIPNYTQIASSGGVGGYRMIEGQELTPSLFRTLNRVSQEAVLVQFGEFFNVLHSLPISLIARKDGSIPRWNNRRFSEQYFNERRLRLTQKLDADLLKSLDQLYAAFDRSDSSCERLIHGDLTSGHVLLTQDTRKLGVIDFGDAVAGDAADDFAILWTYADWAAPFVFERYAFKAGDIQLLGRSRWHAARHRADRVWWLLQGRGRRSSLGQAVTELESELVAVGG